MQDLYIKGHIRHEKENYTFVYENGRLTLIAIKNSYDLFGENRKIDWFKGQTLDGFIIIFYINSIIYFKDGSCSCSPRCILIFRKKELDFDNAIINSLTFSGGIINRFYSNSNLISTSKGKIIFKNTDEPVSEEKVDLNGTETTFQFSVMDPELINDGSIKFGDFNSLLRIKYSSEKNCESVIKDLVSVINFFEFCANRKDITVDKIFLEVLNEDSKYEKIIQIMVPHMVGQKNKTNIFDYKVLKNNINGIFNFLENCNYIFGIIPKNNKDYDTISDKDYCAAFSCFESIQHYICDIKEDEESTKEEIALNEVKNEIVPVLDEMAEKYKGINKLKRDFIKRFTNIIYTSNYKLEKGIISEIEKRPFIVDSLRYKIKNAIKNTEISASVSKAVGDRDILTHNNLVRLDIISIGIYRIILMLNYAMILEYIGVSKDKYAIKMQQLSLEYIV